LCILTGAYDDQYLAIRSDSPLICTSAGKRLKLYAAIAEAAGSPLLILSPQPKGRRRVISTLPAVSSQFGDTRQLFSKASRLPKLRIILNLAYYALHVNRKAPADAIFIVDNYEFIYFLALWVRRLFGKRSQVIIEYEDGKHVIDKGWQRVLSFLAEKMGRPLVIGGILATPSLAARLPGVPTVCVPGVLQDATKPFVGNKSAGPMEFIYSGSLDAERGVPLLLAFLDSPLVPAQAHFHITGQGWLTEACVAVAAKNPQRVSFHGILDQVELARLRAQCHYGLNLQRSGDPVSEVTYPSKTFDYLNAGLRIVSTSAAGVPQVLGDGAIYLPSEDVEGLAAAISQACDPSFEGGANLDGRELYSHRGTVERLQVFFREIFSV